MRIWFLVSIPVGIIGGDAAAQLTEAHRLKSSDGAAGDVMGWSLAISGKHCVAGAARDDDLGASSGSAYVYD